MYQMKMLKKLLSVTSILVKEQTLQSLNSQLERNQKLKPMFDQATNPHKRKENKLYWNDKLCIPEESTKKQIL